MDRIAYDFTPSNPGSPAHYDSSQTALLLLDYHSFITSRSGPSAPAVLSNAARLREWAFKNHVLVVHCLIDISSTFPTAKSASRFDAIRAMLGAHPEQAAEDPAIAPISPAVEGEITVTRQAGHISALKSPELMPLLEQKGIKSLVLCGLSTSGCAMSTARAAGDEEFVTTVIKDACADNVEGLHDMLIQHAFTSQAHVVSAEEWLEAWAGRN